MSISPNGGSPQQSWKAPRPKPSIWKTHTAASLSAETRKIIETAMGSNSIFLGFTHDQIVESITSMQRVDFAPKQQIITRGNIGDKVYIVESGQCRIHNPQLGDPVTYGPGDVFGELALMFNAPRGANVTAITQARLWSLDRMAYRRIISGSSAQLPLLQWPTVERAFYQHAGSDLRLQLGELRSMLARLFRVELNHSDSTGQSAMDSMLDAIDTDRSGDIDIDELRAAWRTWFGGAIRPVRCLVIIDVQNDFIDGTLKLRECPAGQDGAAVVPVINAMRQQNAFDFTAISMDWHPHSHCSFAECAAAGEFPAPLHPSQDEAGARATGVMGSIMLTAPDGVTAMKQLMWPRHCVANTWGAACHKELVQRPSDIIVYKGTDPRIDSYSCVYDNSKYKQTTMLRELRERGVTHVYLCGIATDVCVAFSALHMAEEGFVTTVVEDACAGVHEGGIQEKRVLMASAGVQLVQSAELPSLLSSASLRDALHAASRIRNAKAHVLSVQHESGHAGSQG